MSGIAISQSVAQLMEENPFPARPPPPIHAPRAPGEVSVAAGGSSPDMSLANSIPSFLSNWALDGFQDFPTLGMLTAKASIQPATGGRCQTPVPGRPAPWDYRQPGEHSLGAQPRQDRTAEEGEEQQGPCLKGFACISKERCRNQG